MISVFFFHPKRCHWSLPGMLALALLSVGILQAGPAEEGGEAGAVARALEDREEGYLLLQQGDGAYQEGNYQAAWEAYLGAHELFPVQASATATLREAAAQRMMAAGQARVQQLRRVGGYDEAEKILTQLEELRRPAVQAKVEELRGKNLDPLRSNPALTPQHAANVDAVRRELYTAEGFYNLGQFDQARESYQAVLRRDPYNVAARRGMERVSQRLLRYGAVARDEARARLLMEVDEGWELDRNLSYQLPDLRDGIGVLDEKGSAREELEGQLNSLMVQEVNIDGATLEEAVDYLRELSGRLAQPDALGRAGGIDFIVNLGPEDDPQTQATRAARISLQLRQVPLRRILDDITASTGTDYQVEDYAVVIRPVGATSDDLLDRVFRVPIDFLTRDAVNAQNTGRDPFEGDVEHVGLETRLLTARQKLENLGVKFPEGALANYNPGNSQLLVRNTQDQLRFVSQLVASMAESEPVAVIVRATILDVEAKSLEELGYDWIFNDAWVGDDFIMNGGTQGNGATFTDTLAGNPVTAGNRSGNGAVRIDSITEALSRANPTVSGNASSAGGNFSNLGSTSQASAISSSLRAPGVFNLQQVIDSQLAQMMMRGLSQVTGKDKMSRKTVVTRSGQSATVESVREFIYPTEYEPPEVPTTLGGGADVDIVILDDDGNVVIDPDQIQEILEQFRNSSPTVNTVPVTPAHPTAFEMRKIGTYLNVMPQVSPDRMTINLDVEPVITEFEGFVNYGVPIRGATNAFDLVNGEPEYREVQIELTPNAILMPVFRTIRSNSNVTIADGQTLMLGGIRDSRVTRVEDGVPFLKDLPMLGRFFESEVDQVVRKATLIFLQVELLDAAGEPIRNRLR